MFSSSISKRFNLQTVWEFFSELLIKIPSLFSFSFSITLQEVYDLSEPYGDYDKYVILESNSAYSGGLGIYEGNIFIDCNGALPSCELDCYDEECEEYEIDYCNNYTDWLNDGTCDTLLNCLEFNYDGGDCDSINLIASPN